MPTDPALPDAAVKSKPRQAEETRTRRVPPYHVILLNDSQHSFEFVISVLRKALGFSEERAFQLAQEAHVSGRSVIWTAPREVAELKADQVRSFHEVRGHDGVRLGPLGCRIEPAPG